MSTILEMQIDELQEELTAIKAINQKLQLEKNALEEQLTLTDVSQQRELLLAFEEYCCKLEYLTPNYEMLEKHINSFLPNNCG